MNHGPSLSATFLSSSYENATRKYSFPRSIMLIIPLRTHICSNLVSRALYLIFLPNSLTMTPFFQGQWICFPSFLTEQIPDIHILPPESLNLYSQAFFLLLISFSSLSSPIFLNILYLEQNLLSDFSSLNFHIFMNFLFTHDAYVAIIIYMIIAKLIICDRNYWCWWEVVISFFDSFSTTLIQILLPIICRSKSKRWPIKKTLGERRNKYYSTNLYFR